MRIYVIHRPGIAGAASGLDAALLRLRSFEEQPSGVQARWLHSCALRDADGSFGLSCVFEADSVQAIEQHAARTGLPAREILPVVATLSAHPFAPTMVYRVRRRNRWQARADLDRSAAAWRRVAEQDMARQLSWLHSYAVAEEDGTLGSVCFYQAVDIEPLREHALRTGTPADEIVPVVGRIVFRDEALARAAAGSALPA